MNKPDFSKPGEMLEEFSKTMNKVIENSPMKDIQKNVKAMATAGFNKLELVTREEFELQTELLNRSFTRICELEAKIAELEQKFSKF